MRVGIVQSNYIPWRGYFDFIDDVDAFVLLDDVQYTVRDWRNRNRVKTPNGLTWLSVSLRRSSRDQLVQDVPIDWEVDWAGRHVGLLRQNYRDAPWHVDVIEEFGKILSLRHRTLSQLNAAMIRWIMGRLAIDTPLIDAASLRAQGRKTERLISLVQAVGGTTYISGPAAEAYLDLDAFRREGIGLEYKSYDYENYPQLWGQFEGSVSILDLLMNTGPDARRFLKSRTPDRIVLAPALRN